MTKELKMKANDIRKDIVSMIAQAGSGHPGGSLSCADIMTALYFGGVLNYDASNPRKEDRDRFVMAKGHAAPALYATLAHAGYFPREELKTLRKLGSRLQGHPDMNLLPGVEVSTGSLGVFTIMGDGETEEGQVWEAAMFAAHQKLDHLVAIIDHNHLQIDGNIENVCNPEDLRAKFAAFGWDVRTVDGHDVDALVEVLSAAKADRGGKPHMIVAETIKGKGVSFMENQASWHGSAPNAQQAAQALEELEEAGKVICNG